MLGIISWHKAYNKALQWSISKKVTSKMVWKSENEQKQKAIYIFLFFSNFENLSFFSLFLSFFLWGNKKSHLEWNPKEREKNDKILIF